MTELRLIATTSMIFAWSTLPALAAAPPGVTSATAAGHIGLLPAASFRLADGKCSDCATLKPALWYFRDEV